VYRSPILGETLVGAVERCGAWAGSDQIKAVEATRDPDRPKRLVVAAQAQGGRPATGSRPRTPSYKFTSTIQRTYHTKSRGILVLRED